MMHKILRRISLAVIALSPFFPDFASAQVRFNSTDSVLSSAFTWAKNMAMGYVHDDGSPVGLWYEAALPGRDAFCMRDLAHQVPAAEILGLKDYNINMLRHIAEGISESKDWCSFWEIDRLDRPAPCDYANDKEFWYNLPANFDVMRACRQAFLWNGDSVYVLAPEFQNFYKHTAHDYAQRWNLTPDSIMSRRRFMNTPEPFDRKNGFHTCRGLPSYAENFSGITVAIDLLGAIEAGYEAYAAFCKAVGDREDHKLAYSRTDSIRKIMDEQWWDEANNRYNTYFTENGEFHRGEGIPYLLLIGAAGEADRVAASVEDVLSRDWNVENLSAFPAFLYRYGYLDDARRIMRTLPSMKRSDYPEVSFGIVEGVIAGALGVEANAPESTVGTCHRTNDLSSVSEVLDLPFNGGTVDIKHNGRTHSTFTNHTSRPVRWFATFLGNGSVCDGDGHRLPTDGGQDVAGNPFSTGEITVNPGETASAHFLPEE